jgi:hypothetical protein
MKKTYKKFMMALAVATGLFILSSCKDYLDIPLPTNSLSTVTAFESQGIIDGMMYNMYYSFCYNVAAGTDVVRQSEALADNAYNPTTNTTILDQQNAAITPATYTCIVNWGNAYRTIFLANSMMEGLKEVKTSVLPEATKNTYIAAAKTIRAWTYFMLVRIYGDVPLLTTSTVEENKDKGRDPKTDVYKLIEEDLKDAMSKLPATTGARYFINNKYIPESMLADMYLNQGKWAEAETAATDVIASGKYQLAANLDDVFLQTSKEPIFACGFTLYWNDNAPKAGATGGYLLWPDGFPSYETIFPALSPDLQNSFEPGDLRKTTWVKLSNTGKYTDPTNRMFCYKHKYNIVVNTSTVIPAGKEQDQPLKRLAEMYLIRAEARARQNNLAGAAADLNLIRTRAGLANTSAAAQNDLIEAVIKERRVELFHENASRWFDLVRTGKADALLSVLSYKKANWKPYMVLFPIHQDVLNANPKLGQTPGY